MYSWVVNKHFLLGVILFSSYPSCRSRYEQFRRKNVAACLTSSSSNSTLPVWRAMTSFPLDSAYTSGGCRRRHRRRRRRLRTSNAGGLRARDGSAGLRRSDTGRWYRCKSTTSRGGTTCSRSDVEMSTTSGTTVTGLCSRQARTLIDNFL